MISTKTREFHFVPMRRPAGKVSVQLSSKEPGDIFKDRAIWLLEALGAYRSHRAGYCLSPKRAEVFAKLYNGGWSASRRLWIGDKRPYTFTLPDDETQYTLKQALAKTA